MNKLYTIGFTKKSAADFFGILKENNITKVIDIRLNNTSQLAGFSKYPDIEFFLREIIDVDYIHDPMFSPLEVTLKRYKSKKITWIDYMVEFEATMNERRIKEYILNKYFHEDRLCLLCSEALPTHCHRSLVANIFKELLNCEIINL